MAFSTAVPNTTPDAAAALIEQAVSLILANFVDPLNSATLFSAAYDGAAAELQAVGKTTPATRPAFSGDEKQDTATFRQAYLALMASAEPAINQTAIAYMAIQAVKKSVDECHTYFLDPESYRLYNERSQGNQSYGGIGATIRSQTQPAIIGEVFPGTPAEKAGLKPGDALLAVDGVDVTNQAADQIVLLVRGPEGTTLRLTIQRPGEAAPRDITITRAKIVVPVFTWRVIDGPNGSKIGYMKLYSFSNGAERELDKALAEFKQQKVNGWVLDLRDNGGGLAATLAAVSSRFFKDGPVAYTIRRDGREEAIPVDPKRLFDQQPPLAVLINGGSASSSEALSAAVQDYGRGRLFGQTSMGCLGVARPYPLADGSAMMITIEKAISPKRREINRAGVQPDTAVAPDPTRVSDPVLDAAVAWLATPR